VFYPVKVVAMVALIAAVVALTSAAVDGSRRSVWVGRGILALIVVAILALSLVRE
jgi:hypothetical protein